jgi:hypothetical protein
MKIDILTFGAGMVAVTVDDEDIIGPFAVHATLPPGLDDPPCFCITHIPSGKVIVPFQNWVWWHKEGALEFARELAAVWDDTDAEQDADGNWRATQTGAEKFRTIRRKLGYLEKKRREG